MNAERPDGSEHDRALSSHVLLRRGNSTWKSARRPSRWTRKRREPTLLSTVDRAERFVNDPGWLPLTF